MTTSDVRPINTGNVFWKAADGRTMSIREMTDDHLINALRYSRINAIMRYGTELSAAIHGRYLFKGGVPTREEIEAIRKSAWQDRTHKAFAAMLQEAQTRKLTWEDNEELKTLGKIISGSIRRIAKKTKREIEPAARAHREVLL